MEQLDLQSLIGLHKLTGVDFDTSRIEEWEGSDTYKDCAVVNFTLDGITYTACEDPSDGYRSMMRYLRISETSTKNTFPPVRVLAKMKEGSEYEPYNDVLELVDCVTGKIVLAVGTGNTKDYYPYWVAHFTPEHMAVNMKEAEKSTPPV